MLNTAKRNKEWKRWFPVPDSLVRKTDGTKGKYYNVEARFEDTAILNLEKSRQARKSVFDVGIVLHTRVVLSAYGRAIPNMTSQPIRFDKGDRLRQEDFSTMKALIWRCWDAWEHYQIVRLSLVTPLESEAILQLNAGPLPHRAIAVPSLPVAYSDDEDEDEDEEPAPVMASVKAEATQKRRGGLKRASL